MVTHVLVSCDACLLSHTPSSMHVVTFAGGKRETVCPSCLRVTEAEGVYEIADVEAYCAPVLPGQAPLFGEVRS